MSSLYYQSPIGTMRLQEQDGALSGVSFVEDNELADEIPHPVLLQAKQQLEEYFRGQRRLFQLPLTVSGTAFRKKAWQALQKIPFGVTKTYAEQAGMIGNPKAARAVGQANHHNPLSVIIPCHRVVGVAGRLTGYASGVGRKEWLLAHEEQYSAD